ncbi:hypothetical protein [Undibacterium danionis]|uniref:Uncharacterized protein n=1 Tax=Undibacterium danionis TaxID=1812100 RepID=A0ABV6IJL2_9BURK
MNIISKEKVIAEFDSSCRQKTIEARAEDVSIKLGIPAECVLKTLAESYQINLSE